MTLTAPLPRTTLRSVLRAERIKVATIRSTRWTAIVAAGLTLVITALMTVTVLFAPPEPGMDVEEMIAAMFGPRPVLGTVAYAVLFAPALVGILGALVVSTERATGVLGATVAAVPKRRLIVTAKLIVSGVLSASIGLIVGVAAFWIAEPGFAARGDSQPFADPITAQVIVGGAVYLGLIGSLGAALAVFVRSTVAAFGIVLGALVVGPSIIQAIPVVGPPIAAVLPTNLGAGLFLPVDESGWLSVAVAGAGLIAWVAATSVAAALVFARSDV